MCGYARGKTVTFKRSVAMHEAESNIATISATALPRDATKLERSFLSSIRIGNEEYAKANKSFGLTTLRNRHAEIHGESLRLHFRKEQARPRYSAL